MRGLLVNRLRPFLLAACAASFIMNLALLIPAIYILQVFNRAFASQSSEMLVTITAVAVLTLSLGYFADNTRARALSWASRALDRLLSPIELESSLKRSAAAGGRSEVTALRDIGLLRSFLNSSSAVALLDVPWLPIYLLTIAWMHPLLGLVAALGIAILIGIVAVTDLFARSQAEAAVCDRRAAAEHVQELMRSAEVIVAMGMTEAAIAGEREWNDRLQQSQEQLSRTSMRLNAVVRVAAPVLQVVMFGCAAWLVIGGRASIGIMVASALLLSRTLQPLEQLTLGWQGLSDARGAWSRLSRPAASIVVAKTRLPDIDITGKVELERVACVLSPGRPAFLRGVSLRLDAGDSILIVGPSGCGKTTLARLLLGILPAQSGEVRLDDASIARWDRSTLGQHVGYVPQDAQLSGGTIAESIARFGTLDSTRVVQAAQLAHVHEMIVRLPAGYHTQIGTAGATLCAGLRRRIALARALYGDPRLVMLDEPNAELDAQGELALIKTLAQLKERGTTVIMLGQRTSLVEHVDRLAILRDGSLRVLDRDDAESMHTPAAVVPFQRLPAASPHSV
jgi:PrtD family type I secretion system ABC transporter